MSAYLVTPEHIAACAAVIEQEVYECREIAPNGFGDGKRGIPLPDIRTELARHNVLSVSYRYSTAGREAYAPLFAQLVGLKKYLEDIGKIEPARPDNLPGLKTGSTAAQFVLECRTREKSIYDDPSDNWSNEKKAQAIKHLCCLRYQSCEHAEFEDSDARRWLNEAIQNLGIALADAIDTKHTWSLDEAA